MAWRGAGFQTLPMGRRGARRSGFALAGAILALGLYNTALAFLVPINLAEARNFGDELCLMAATGTLAGPSSGGRLEYTEGLNEALHARLRAMAPALAKGCHVIVEPGDIDAGRGVNFGVVLGLIAYGGREAISIQLYRDPLFTPLLGYLSTGVDPTRGLVHVCCFVEGHAIVSVLEGTAAGTTSE